MRSTRLGVHWVAPTLMLGCLALGTLTAMAHDQFYHHHNRAEVGSRVSQTVISDVAIGFAFTVKMFLCIATSTVFIQQLMYDLKRQGESISDIDSLFDVLNNILQLRKLPLWLRHWRLLLFALITWSMPLAAVFTPGTLNVKSDLQINRNIGLKPVRPQQSWIGKQQFAAVKTDASASWRSGEHVYARALYQGASGELRRTVVSTLSRQEILPIPPPRINSSYSLSFFGPAIECQSMSTDDLHAFNASLDLAYRTNHIPGPEALLDRNPNSGTTHDIELKYNAWLDADTWNFSNPNWNDDPRSSNTWAENKNTLYIYLSRHFAQISEAILLSCHLHNATYHVDFAWNPVQTISIRSVQIAEPVTYNSTILEDVSADYGLVVYNAFWDAFNRVMVGAATNTTTSKWQFEPTGVAYISTLVDVTKLRDLIEDESDVAPPAQDVIDIIHSMFHNITVSTMSSPILSLPMENSTETTGTTWRSVNVYDYEPKTLYIAYGSAILATSLCVAWGMTLLYRYNRAAYSLSFSSILRTTRRREFNNAVSWNARKGQDPVPTDVKDLKLRYHIDTNCGNDGFALVSGADEFATLVTTEDPDIQKRPNSTSTFSWASTYSGYSGHSGYSRWE